MNNKYIHTTVALGWEISDCNGNTLDSGLTELGEKQKLKIRAEELAEAFARKTGDIT